MEARSPGHQAFLDARRQRVAALRREIDRCLPEPGEVVLEIGCGHGHYLAAYAQQHHEARCLGIDLVTRRIQLACRKRDKRGLDNLHFLKAEVNEFLDAWPDRLKLERVFLLFPDPWPKKRHAKNRILQLAFLEKLGTCARPGTALHFRTDDPANFAWGQEIIAGQGDWRPAPGTAWPFENPSYFQDLFDSYQSLTVVFRPAAGP